ncbi:hypothetical protein [Acinetobacter pittii]|uniref:hypothetical protein n=1 Tax=Acinetobacter pittii TaxID=48296 RepID=UPI00148D0E20|nr:hypothetical protein [Acinetobacter pittii]
MIVVPLIILLFCCWAFMQASCPSDQANTMKLYCLEQSQDPERLSRCVLPFSVF